MIERVNGIQKCLHSGEAALVMNDSDRFYLTGFRSSAGIVLITPTSSYFLIDFRYFEKASAVVSHMNVILLTDRVLQLKKILQADRVACVYVRTHVVSYYEFSRLNTALGGVLSESDLLDRQLEKMRQIKSQEEIQSIMLAQSLTEKTFEYILPRIAVGRTEREVMLEMEFYMRKLGSEGVAFDFIVVSGKNSSLPHGVPTDKEIEKGDFITLDFGAVVNGYRSDMTRTVAVGEVSEKQRFVYDTVLAAQEAALERIAPGRICREIDAIARSLIDSRGFAGCFGHGLGHSVGIDIHESPSFNTTCDTALLPGMVMTVEPGIYLENTFGVRIEDMVLVTETGCRNLTACDKNLIILS